MKSHYNQIWVVSLIMFGLLLTDTATADIETSIQFQPPPEEEQPRDTEGAASRNLGECNVNDLESTQSATEEFSLTALVPQNNYGLTTQEHPSFWVYFPDTSAQRAILSIKEVGKSPHWQQSVDLNQKGIVGIELSQNAPALKIGKNYQWAVIMVCSDRPSPNDPVVTSWIKRVEDNNQSSSISKLDRVSIYAQQGIWYDALDILISQKSSGDNWQKLWHEYLESADLTKLTDLPVVENPLLPK